MNAAVNQYLIMLQMGRCPKTLHESSNSKKVFIQEQSVHNMRLLGCRPLVVLQPWETVQEFVCFDRAQYSWTLCKWSSWLCMLDTTCRLVKQQDPATFRSPPDCTVNDSKHTDTRIMVGCALANMQCPPGWSVNGTRAQSHRKYGGV